ncbi:MAG: hypothetical protein R6V06_00485 [Kiritimatiellia bacterium]
MKKGKIAALGVTVLLLGGNSLGAASEPVTVNTSPNRNGYWSRVCTNAVPLRWEWREEAAVKADLTVTGLRGTQTVSFTKPTTNWTWQVSSALVPAEEDLAELTLIFYDDQNVVTSEYSARLSVLPGAFGATSVIMSDTDNDWTHVRDAAVISYDACWTEDGTADSGSRLVIEHQDGFVQTNLLSDAASYYGWKLRGGLWGYGTFNLALDFPGTTDLWEAVLIRVRDGSMILLY